MANSFATYRGGLNPINYYGGRSFLSTGGGTGSGGGTAYGGIPAPIAVPPNRQTQAFAANPALGGLQTGAGAIASSEQSGQVSQNTRNALATSAAERGVGRGMPGATDFTNADLFSNIAGYSENRQRQGLQDYESLLSGTEAGMTDPNLATSIADRNSIYAAAPDPALAARQQMQNYLTALTAARGPNRGTGIFYRGGQGGGTQSAGVSSPPSLDAAMPSGWNGTATSGSVTDNPVVGRSSGMGYWSGSRYIEPNSGQTYTDMFGNPTDANGMRMAGPPSQYGRGGVDPATAAYYNWLDQQHRGNTLGGGQGGYSSGGGGGYSQDDIINSIFEE